MELNAASPVHFFGGKSGVLVEGPRARRGMIHRQGWA
jgi:hypothetical protein